MRATASILVSLLLLAGAGCDDPGDDPGVPDAAQPPRPDASAADAAPLPDGAAPDPVDAALLDAAPDPADASPPPDAVEPPPDAPPPGPLNQHTDRYDPAGDRMLVSHCGRDAVVAIDAASGVETVIADGWPFTEGGSVCPRDLTRAADNTSFHAVVSRSFQNDRGDGCRSQELVTISAQGEVTLVKGLYIDCSDDSGGNETYDTPLLDKAHDRVMLLRDDCGSGECDSDIIGISPVTAEQRHVFQIFRGGDVFPEPRGKALVFDPAAPDSRVLALISQDNTVDVIDVDSETREVLLTVQTSWAGRVVTPQELNLNVAGQRLFVTGPVVGGRAVIVIDLASGDQELLYDGAANAQGDRITCAPQVAFDSTRNRLLMFVNPGFQCTEGLYAIDAVDGTLTRLPYTPAPSAAHARPQP
jgi:DNA-binding beta-propeller fold protein YncE